MALMFLDLANLRHLDGGKPAIAFRRAVEDAINDCRDRLSSALPEYAIYLGNP
jgi:hypothetical protein